MNGPLFFFLVRRDYAAFYAEKEQCWWIAWFFKKIPYMLLMRDAAGRESFFIISGGNSNFKNFDLNIF